MEYLPGGELYELLVKSPPMQEEVAFKLVEQLADCLNYLHHMGIIHRDIKVGISLIVYHNDSLKTSSVLITPR